MSKTEEQKEIDERVKDFKEEDDNLEMKIRQLEEDVRLLKEKNREDEIIKRLYFDEELNEVFTAVPTYIPKTFTQQFCFYDTAGVRRLYVYVNSSWRFITLT